MTERRKDLLVLTLLLTLFTLFFSKILFTDQIIRAPDIINEMYWTVKDIPSLALKEVFKFKLIAEWMPFDNSGETTEGGWTAVQFLWHQRVIFHFIPSPANVAWYIMFHQFVGAAGAYFCARTIGASRIASSAAGIIFALAPENASLINAGHVMKMATISLAPWGFYFVERTFQTRRVIYALTAAVVLAFQFFHSHWQISFYTCLALAVYGLLRCIYVYREEPGNRRRFFGIIGLNLVVLFFFLTTVSISLFSLASWSRETNRGSQSGANQGKGGLQYEEAMSWSLPPEELAAFVVPGFFGFSRQEAGENPPNIDSYYWGRMNFTQTTSYVGFLPWLLLPLPLLFRRDRYTWLALAGVVGGILFSMGKYTLFYQLLFEYFPGINKFRVPKMMMFIPVLGLGVLAARGLDCLREETVRQTKEFSRYLWGAALVPVLILVCLGIINGWEERWINQFIEYLAQPTRYEQGMQLVAQRLQNIRTEMLIAAALTAAHAGVILACGRRRLAVTLLPLALIGLYLLDVGRVNAKFMFLVDVPQKSRGEVTPAMKFVAKDSPLYRTLPLAGDPMQFANAKIPVLFTSHPVQLVRWQEYLDNLSLTSPLVDMLNLKYLVMPAEQYLAEKGQLATKYDLAYQSPDGKEIVLQNRTVLPKAWLVTEVIPVSHPGQALALLQSPNFDPARAAIVESPPPIPLGNIPASGAGTAEVTHYEGELVDIKAITAVNSLLVLGDKYYRGWKATVDGKPTEIHRVDYLLRGIYLLPGTHEIRFTFDPLPFKVGKYLTLASLAFFAGMLIREWRRRGKYA